MWSRGRLVISYTQILPFTENTFTQQFTKWIDCSVFRSDWGGLQIGLMNANHSTKLWFIKSTKSDIHQMGKNQSISISYQIYFTVLRAVCLFNYVRIISRNDGVYTCKATIINDELSSNVNTQSHESTQEHNGKSSMTIVAHWHEPMITIASNCWLRNYFR